MAIRQENTLTMGNGKRIQEFTVSSVTVELAARLASRTGAHCGNTVFSGSGHGSADCGRTRREIDNKKRKAESHAKAKVGT